MRFGHLAGVEPCQETFPRTPGVEPWAPRLYITKVEPVEDGMLRWESEFQFGWQDSPSYEGFKLIGSVPTSSDESLHLHRRINYSVKPSLIKGDKETRKMTIEF